MSNSFAARALIVMAVAAASILVTRPLPAADTAALYRISKSIPLGAPERWDYLTFEPASHRIYVAHGDKIEVFDTQSEKIVGQIPVEGSNGAAIVPAVGKGYAGSRTAKSVVVFDLNTFKVVKMLPTAEDTDAVVYDPASKRVFVMHGDPHSMTAIDTATDSVAATISLSGQPEFAVVDGAGKLFVNIEDKREIQRVDTKSGKIEGDVVDCVLRQPSRVGHRYRRTPAVCQLHQFKTGCGQCRHRRHRQYSADRQTQRRGRL